MEIQKNPNGSNTTENSNSFFSGELAVYPATSVAENINDEEYIRLLTTIAEFSTDAIFSKTFEGIIKSWNKGSEKIFGYTATEMIGKNISLIIPPECIEQEKTMLNRVSRNFNAEPYETTIIKKGGEQLYISFTVSPLKDGAGNTIGVFNIGRDITLSKKLEAGLVTANKELAFQIEEKEKRAAELIVINHELQTAQIQLKEVNTELEAFTYSVSHDLRAPLRAVNSYAQILREDYEQTLGTDGMQILENICYNSKKMGALIDELLSFSRLGRLDIDRIEINMNEFVQSIVKDFNRTTEHHATIRVGLMPTVEADYTLLRQALLNLLSNAVKYSAKKEQPEVDIFVELQNDKYVFAIKDNGAGFDMRFVDKLFGVFQRLHTEKEFEGNGVGLSIVHRIISKHGGRVWAQSKENEGATFYFTIN